MIERVWSIASEARLVVRRDTEVARGDRHKACGRPFFRTDRPRTAAHDSPPRAAPGLPGRPARCRRLANAFGADPANRVGGRLPATARAVTLPLPCHTLQSVARLTHETTTTHRQESRRREPGAAARHAEGMALASRSRARHGPGGLGFDASVENGDVAQGTEPIGDCRVAGGLDHGVRSHRAQRSQAAGLRAAGYDLDPRRRVLDGVL